MIKPTRLANSPVAILILVVLSVCGTSGCAFYQATEAHTLAREGDDITQRALKEYQDSQTQLGKLIDINITDTKKFLDYKESNATKIDELENSFSKLDKDLNLAAVKFDQAGKFDVEPKFKEGLDVTALLLKKRTEASRLWGEFLTAFEKEDDPEVAMQLINDYGNKIGGINVEGDALLLKLQKILDENPDLFGK